MLLVLKRTVSILYISGPCKTNTVNSEIFTRIFFSRIALKDIHVFSTLKFATRPWCTYISKRQSDLAILREFCFRETSHMGSFAKIKSSRKFLNLQYYWKRPATRWLWNGKKYSATFVCKFMWTFRWIMDFYWIWSIIPQIFNTCICIETWRQVHVCN